MNRDTQPTRFGDYDRDMQMFCSSPKDPDQQQLRWLRWLGEQGKLEHPVAGPSSGVYADRDEEVS